MSLKNALNYLPLAITISTSALSPNTASAQDNIKSSVASCIEAGKNTNGKGFSSGIDSEGVNHGKNPTISFGDIGNIEDSCEGIIDKIRELGNLDRGTSITGGKIYKSKNYDKKERNERKILKDIALERIGIVLGKYNFPKEAISPLVFHLFVDAYVGGHLNNGFKPIRLPLVEDLDKNMKPIELLNK